MSRDHYKGSRKDRDARVDADGKIKPLSKTSKEVNLSVDKLSTPYENSPYTAKYIYARITGNDISGDGTLEKPYRTFKKCLDDVPALAGNNVWIIDITGIGAESIDGPLTFPSFTGPTAQHYGYGSSLGLPNTLMYISPINIIAAPDTVEEITITSQASAPETRIRNYTVSGASWPADQFKGKLLRLGPEGSTGRIVSNTEDTLFTLTTTSYTGPATIMEESVTITAGFDSVPDDYVPLYTPNTDFSMADSSITVYGINFIGRQLGSLNSSVRVAGKNASFYSCSFQGMFSEDAYLTLIGCHLNSEYFYMFGGAFSSHSSFYEGTTFALTTGSQKGQKDEFIYCYLLECDPFGYFGTNAGAGPPEVKFLRNTVVSGTGNGVQVANNAFMYVEECLLQDNVGDAVFAESGAAIEVSQCIGSGNGGYGVRITHGAHARITNPISVTGDLGDYKVGILLPDTWANFEGGFKNVIDITPVSGTLSRMYNTDSY